MWFERVAVALQAASRFRNWLLFSPSNAEADDGSHVMAGGGRQNVVCDTLACFRGRRSDSISSREGGSATYPIVACLSGAVHCAEAKSQILWFACPRELAVRGAT